MTLETLHARAGEGLLSGAQYWVFEDIKSINFLLNEEEACIPA